MSTFITVLYVFCCVAAILLFLAVAAFITWYCVVDRPDSRAGHASGAHNWFAPELLAPARHALCAAMNLPGPDVSDYAKCRAGEFQNVPGPAAGPPPAVASPPATAGPGTLHRTEIHHNAALAWQAAGHNATARNWTPHGIEDTTSWDTKLSAQLRVMLDGAENTGAYVDRLFRRIA